MKSNTLKNMECEGKVSETNTENIFRGFYGTATFIEKTAIPNSFGFKSKNKTEEIGYPDFLKEEEDFVIIVEAKKLNHRNAIEDLLFYMRNNNVKKDLIGIAISGQTLKSYKASFYFRQQGEKEEQEIITNEKLISLSDLIKLYRQKKYGDTITTENLIKTLKTLNKTFHEEIKIPDTERSLFFSGLMIALKDNTFINTYRNIAAPSKEEKKVHKVKLLDSHNLNEAILQAITRQIENKANNHSKEYNWRDKFSFIKNIDYTLLEYINIISEVETTIFLPFKNDEKQDILGRAYKIFLSRAGNIENKNIILTPDHIKELMVELARLSVDDVVLEYWFRRVFNGINGMLDPTGRQ